jgi:hydrogenase maturation protein HypF
MHIRRKVEVSGIVQGVGFRPYIYRLATENHLAGTIRNTSWGVSIEVQGEKPAVDAFISRLSREAPPLARITDIVTRDLACNGDRNFRIVASHAEETVRTLISPDVATCDDCLREMFDPRNRRYRYPFTNCTNCGPRFTIVHDIPYDRPRTSMAKFKMCGACQAEYDNPLDRRFHAQPNACWDCGPQLEWWDRKVGRLEGRDPIAEAVAALSSGQITAVKGLGGFHLAADATKPATVALLRERKRRVGKPFAIMIPNLRAAEDICQLSEAEISALQSVHRPIVLLLRRGSGDGLEIAADVAPGNHYLGLFLPYTPLHHLLLAEGKFKALVMTSGNLSEEPIAIANDEARSRLGGLADYFLMHNRDILLRCDDSVVRVLPTHSIESEPSRSWPAEAFNRKGHKDQAQCAEKIQHLRRARGFVPVPVFLNREVPSILAVGGELKNTICLTQGKHAFLSQHLGDLENLESYKFFAEAIDHLEKVLEIRPQLIAYDLHPDYFSTRWALQRTDMPLIGVQHHHAHIASCMAENHLEGKVIGFALDGTGYGTDGKIWGGEVLIAGYQGFKRAAHIEYIPLPGGAAAIHEPWRMAVSYLSHHFGNDFRKMDLPFLRETARPKLEMLQRALERRINSPLTSSCGRLFDAVAALAGIRQQVTYEAQAAIELEMAINHREPVSHEAYPFALVPDPDAPWSDTPLEETAMHNDADSRAEVKNRAPETIRGPATKEDQAAAKRKNNSQNDRQNLIISTCPMFQALLEDIRQGHSASVISRKFHHGLIKVFTQIAVALRHRTSLNRICLSGGTFNNLYLTSRLVSQLQSDGFDVFTQNEVPAGDGGLSLGQAMVAAHQAAGT